MTAILEKYRRMNRLDFNNLLKSEQSKPAKDDSTLFDEKTVDEADDRAFCLFEAGLHEISGFYNKIQPPIRQLADEDAREGTYEYSEPDDETWTLVEQEITEGIVAYDYRTQSEEGVDDPPFIDSPLVDTAKVTEFNKSIAENGRSTSTARLLPSSRKEWFAEACRKTNINTAIEKFCLSFSGKPSGSHRYQDWNVNSELDTLYDLLATRECTAEEHHALLELSGFVQPSQKDPVFDMFLSCCANAMPPVQWHKTTCKHERADPPRNLASKQVNVCHNIDSRRLSGVPLHLSFNHRGSWRTMDVGLDFLLEHESAAIPVTLENLLQQGVLKTEGTLDEIRKFRLAVKLASSLYQLAPGPWMQEIWNLTSVQFIYRNGSPMSMLDAAYVSCALVAGRRERNTCPLVLDRCPVDLCPILFLSFAQILVDIVKGERGDWPTDRLSVADWYKRLRAEINGKMYKDAPMNGYRSAITGCLTYLIKYEDKKQQTSDSKLAAQLVIRDYIVQPLQSHLAFWEEQILHPTVEVGKIQVATSPWKAPLGSAEFVLWSHEDNYFQSRTKESKEGLQHEGGFTARMNQFLRKYIRSLGDCANPVRIAVIDTGFFADEDDDFLHMPDIVTRVKERRNFFALADADADPTDHKDNHGHGTHVARLLLKFAPRAEIFVAKISDTRSLTLTGAQRLSEALQWAGKHADIINLSFGLGSLPFADLGNIIDKLVAQKKLIFAAASNDGGNGSPPFPANHDGVFCIHATKETGAPDVDMNPAPQETEDNFASLGCDIESHWDGKSVKISGTSYATPIAAAIAANILDFARQELGKEEGESFKVYKIIRALFRHRLVDNSGKSVYHYIKPWKESQPGKESLWDGGKSSKEVADELRRHLIYPSKTES